MAAATPPMINPTSNGNPGIRVIAILLLSSRQLIRNLPHAQFRQLLRYIRIDNSFIFVFVRQEFFQGENAEMIFHGSQF